MPRGTPLAGWGRRRYPDAIATSRLPSGRSPGADHVARWDPDAEWIEMRLRSRCDQVVRVPGLGIEVHFSRGEEMRTEISAKFRRSRLEAELELAGFEMVRWWTDTAGEFSLSLSEAV